MLYTIVPDSNHFRFVIWDDAQITKLVGDSNMELRIDMWNSPRTYQNVFSETLRVSFRALTRQAEKLAIPDICVFQGRLFLNTKAFSAVKKIIETDGEFLPVTYEYGDAYIFTPLRVAETVNGLDTKLCRKNEWGDLESLAFYEDKIGSWPLFRCEYDLFMSLHCKQDVKDAIEQAGLKGVFFTKDLGNIFSNQFDGNIRDPN